MNIYMYVCMCVGHVLWQNVTLQYISKSKRDKIMKFSVNNYDGARNITLKNYNDHLIRMGGVRGQIPPTQKS